MDTLSNWGRWGEADTLGTLNLLTPVKRRQAAALVRDGESVSCAKLIPHLGVGTIMGEGGPQSYMVQSGEKYMLHKTDSANPGLEYAIESLSFIFHGELFTHVDDLSHVFYQGKMYNGRPAGLVTSIDGAQEQNVDTLMRDGIYTRGVLLDFARHRGADVADPEDHVYPEDLEAMEEAQGVRAEVGDVLLLRTGYAGQLDRLPAGQPRPEAHSGWSPACLPWFHERGIAMIGSDVINEAAPSPYDPADGPGILASPVHAVAMVAMGMPLLDNANLERLAAVCAEKSRWEFCFTMNPLRLDRATGSPVNPVATF
jgi:kynurenine formamidase